MLLISKYFEVLITKAINVGLMGKVRGIKVMRNGYTNVAEYSER
jgi:hypothetical protein